MRKIEIKGQPWIEVLEREEQRKQVEVKMNSWEQVGNNEDISKDISVKAQPQMWEQITGLQSPSIIRTFDGVNKLNAFSIKDSHATRNKNVTTSNYPALSVRDGYSIYYDAGTNPITGMAVYKGTELHIISGGSWMRRTSAGVWSTLKTGLSTTEKWSFINFQGSFSTMHLIATNGVDAALKYDGTTVANLGNAPTNSNYVATHDNRVYIAAKSTVHFSALRKAEDWNTVDESGQIAVETTDGKDITGIIAGSARLTVFKENSIHELFGTNPGNFTMKTVTENVGTPTGYSAQVINGVIYFLGKDGVYRYSGGSLPDKEFSLPIQEYIKKMEPFRANKSISWTDGQRYYLAICVNAPSPYYPNIVLEYDPIFQTWNVWEFPIQTCVSGVLWDGIYYGGSANGKIMKFGTIWDGVGLVAWEWVSKPFSFQSLASKSRWFRLWIVADIPADSSIAVWLSDKEDGDDSWKWIKTITPNVDVQAQEIQIPVNLVTFSNFIRLRLEGTGPVTIYEVSRQERVFPMGLS